MLREVTNLPSRPANGDVFTLNVMRTVGSSTLDRGERHGAVRHDGLADADVGEARDGADVARAHGRRLSVRLKLL